MTISVTPNANGTITITCGGESVTVGTPSASPKKDEFDDVYLWPNDGAVANIVAGGKAEIKVVPVRSAKDLPKAIKEQHDLHARAPKPTILQFHVAGAQSLSVESINKALSDLGNPAWMGTQIKLTGPRDE
jgi:hypothetical protein